MKVKYSSFLECLSYKGKNKEYFYWTNANEIAVQIVEEFQKRIK